MLFIIANSFFLDEEAVVIAEWYYNHLTELVVNLRAILRQWLEYLDHSHVWFRSASSCDPIQENKA